VTTGKRVALTSLVAATTPESTRACNLSAFCMSMDTLEMQQCEQKQPEEVDNLRDRSLVDYRVLARSLLLLHASKI